MDWVHEPVEHGNSVGPPVHHGPGGLSCGDAVPGSPGRLARVFPCWKACYECARSEMSRLCTHLVVRRGRRELGGGRRRRGEMGVAEVRQAKWLPGWNGGEEGLRMLLELMRVQRGWLALRRSIGSGKLTVATLALTGVAGKATTSDN